MEPFYFTSLNTPLKAPFNLLKSDACGNQTVVGFPTNNGGDFLDNGNKYTNTAKYTYGAIGCMTKDLDRDIVTIRYNILNLPDTI